MGGNVEFFDHHHDLYTRCKDLHFYFVIDVQHTSSIDFLQHRGILVFPPKKETPKLLQLLATGPS